MENYIEIGLLALGCLGVLLVAAKKILDKVKDRTESDVDDKASGLLGKLIEIMKKLKLIKDE